MTEPIAAGAPGIDDLLAYLDASPSPWHAVASSAARLRAAGFAELTETEPWRAVANGFVIRGGALVAWRWPATASGSTPFHIVGAHTDSPCLRIKPRPDTGGFGWRQLAVEVYGGALLNSWLDRDLGVAGRIVLRDGSAVDIAVREPIARVPQLAIHLDREVNDRGLVLDKQQHLTPVWGTGASTVGDFAGWLAERAGVRAADVAWWDLSLFDTTPAAVLGADRSMIASGRLDNQLSCWAATTALAAADQPHGHTALIALFDHEEVGSESSTGASGPLLSTVIERISTVAGGDRESLHQALAGSTCISADNAHAVHPNYPERHEPGHRPIVNQGPAVKVNNNQRYATSATTAALFQRACETAGVPWQVFVSRNNMPCGSTIGPLTATALGIATVDVGIPQLSMHSARELCGTDDPPYLARALAAYFAG
ncbi:MAG: family aminopeptidase [Ilumatobacteraceae bacterium]|nr:family aminopeptidase [Ilumatobacteraceae bacterium]